MIPLLSLIFGFLTTLAVTPLVIMLARKFNISATPWHQKGGKATPLLGGVALYIALIAGMSVFALFLLAPGTIAVKHVFGIFLGATLLLIGGFFDDYFSLPPKWQVIFPIGAILLVIASGIGINYFTNPFSPEKLIYVNTFHIPLLTFNGIPYRITLPADSITFAWLAIIIYSTKLQDGLDGLVSGIGMIGSFFIFLISYFVFHDMPVAIGAALFTGVLAGFLPYNFYPGKIFLGESGSLLVGFMLGVLALLSDAKIVITLLLLSVPIADAVWAVVRRTYHRRPFWKGDQQHLHHLLIQSGFSPRRAVLLLYGITTTFGVLVMLWQSSFQYYFYGVALLIAFLILLLFFATSRKSNGH